MIAEDHRYPAAIRAALAIVEMLDLRRGKALMVGTIAFKILRELRDDEESEPAPGIARVPVRDRPSDARGGDPARR